MPTLDARIDAPAAVEPTPDDIAHDHRYRDLGLSDTEYDSVVELLGRRPNWTETGIFGVMWSEHCSYKSSKHLLRRLPSSAPHVLQGPGENAGVVDVGDGLAVVFKVESHNHPSAIEPFHGAATGVGGILRDVFTMGARPIALLNSLRFGPLDGAGDSGAGTATQRLFAGVVEGIAHYGNCVGVPTVGGEIAFDDSYTLNPLVNAMCVGLLRHDEVQLGTASGVGNPVFCVGARTGRDGIHGATFASVEDPHGRERSAIQIGDPFLEKLLIEACLELLATGVVVGMQDMGAAGLTSSSVEMAERAGSGLELDLARVPRREAGMTPYELMLSESQERMLVVLEHGRQQVATDIFARWGLECAEIGRVTDSGVLCLCEGDEVVAELPLAALVDGAPSCVRPVREPVYLARTRAFDVSALPDIDPGTGVGPALHRLLSRPAIASKAWVHDQFDSMVGAATVVRPGSDAAVIALRGTDRAIAMSMDGNGRWCWLDPRVGAAHAVAEAARNVVCSGARPLAVTDCLNFSSPEDPETAWQIEQAIDGMADACRVLGTPVVSGNVSLYNRSGDVDIMPTPVIGMVGVIEDPAHVTTQAWAGGGTLVLVGAVAGARLDGSEYLVDAHDLIAGGAPPLDLDLERRVQRVVLDAIGAGMVRSAHDVSDGGLAVALAESAIAGGCGAQVTLVTGGGRVDEVLFGEAGSRIVLELDPGRVAAFEQDCVDHGVDTLQIGMSGGDVLEIRLDDRVAAAEPVPDLAASWRGAIPRIMDGGRA